MRAERLQVHYTVQGNHLHLLVEAEDKTALSTGMKGLAVRCARAINGVMGRQGRVFADRYHEHVLKSRREVAHALRYVFGNFAHHAKNRGAKVAAAFLDPFSSVAWFATDVPAGAPWPLRGRLLRRGSRNERATAGSRRLLRRGRDRRRP